jgi:hypothetical protein
MDVVLDRMDGDHGVGDVVYGVPGRKIIGMGGVKFMKEERTVFEEVVKYIKEVHFGEVVVTIHDSEIVQVEKREKKRFNIRK